MCSRRKTKETLPENDKKHYDLVKNPSPVNLLVSKACPVSSPVLFRSCLCHPAVPAQSCSCLCHPAVPAQSCLCHPAVPAQSCSVPVSPSCTSPVLFLCHPAVPAQSCSCVTQLYQPSPVPVSPSCTSPVLFLPVSPSCSVTHPWPPLEEF